MDEDASVISGPGIAVEVDETKLGKRKYHREHRVEGAWVMVGVERTELGRVFLVYVEDRSKDTITRVLHEHVRVGSVVYTDCWRGHVTIDADLELEHATVNHTRCFKDPDTGVLTNTVESMNNALKMKIAPRNRTKDGLIDRLSGLYHNMANPTPVI